MNYDQDKEFDDVAHDQDSNKPAASRKQRTFTAEEKKERATAMKAKMAALKEREIEKRKSEVDISQQALEELQQVEIIKYMDPQEQLGLSQIQEVEEETIRETMKELLQKKQSLHKIELKLKKQEKLAQQKLKAKNKYGRQAKHIRRKQTDSIAEVIKEELNSIQNGIMEGTILHPEDVINQEQNEELSRKVKPEWVQELVAIDDANFFSSVISTEDDQIEQVIAKKDEKTPLKSLHDKEISLDLGGTEDLDILGGEDDLNDLMADLMGTENFKLMSDQDQDTVSDLLSAKKSNSMPTQMVIEKTEDLLQSSEKQSEQNLQKRTLTVIDEEDDEFTSSAYPCTTNNSIIEADFNLMSDRTHSNRKSAYKQIDTIEEDEKDAEADELREADDDEPEQSMDDLFDQQVELADKRTSIRSLGGSMQESRPKTQELTDTDEQTRVNEFRGKRPPLPTTSFQRTKSTPIEAGVQFSQCQFDEQSSHIQMSVHGSEYRTGGITHSQSILFTENSNTSFQDKRPTQGRRLSQGKQEMRKQVGLINENSDQRMFEVGSLESANQFSILDQSNMSSVLSIDAFDFKPQPQEEVKRDMFDNLKIDLNLVKPAKVKIPEKKPDEEVQSENTPLTASRNPLNEIITASRDPIFEDSPQQLLEKGIDLSECVVSIDSVLSMLLMEADHKKKTAHLYLVQDEILHKSRVQLKLLYASRKYNQQQKFSILLSLGRIYFSLGKLKTAMDCTEEALQLQPQSYECLLWKALIQFYFILNTTNDQIVNPADQPTWKIIGSCDSALERIESESSLAEQNLKITSAYLHLKLALIVKRSQQPCFEIQKQESPQKERRSGSISEEPIVQPSLSQVYKFLYEKLCSLPEQIASNTKKNIDDYMGFIFYAEIYMSNFSGQTTQDGTDQRDLGLNVLHGLIEKDKKRPEAYLRLWQLYQDGLIDYKKILLDSLQKSKPDSPMKRLSRSFSINEKKSQSFFKKPDRFRAQKTAESILIFCSEMTSTSQKSILLSLLTARSLSHNGNYIRCFELLQQTFIQNPQYTSVLYNYGKFAVKAVSTELKNHVEQQKAAKNKLSSPDKKFKLGDPQTTEAELLAKIQKNYSVDQGFIGSGVGALEECLISCFRERQAKINFYIGLAYKILKMPLKTYRYWIKAHKINQQELNKIGLKPNQTKQIKVFLDEFSFFTRICEMADKHVEESIKGQDQVRDTRKEGEIQQIVLMVQNFEKLDKPNALLFKARIQAYMQENDEEMDFGRGFQELLQVFPSFIDGYIQYWKYLKFRLNRLTGRNIKKPANLMVRKQMPAAEDVEEGSGTKLLTKMRGIAEMALCMSDSTEVPTSLWVEARTIYSKQMIYDKRLKEAIDILKEICFILPPMTLVKGLSFVDNEKISETESQSPELLSYLEPNLNSTPSELMMQSPQKTGKAPLYSKNTQGTGANVAAEAKQKFKQQVKESRRKSIDFFAEQESAKRQQMLKEISDAQEILQGGEADVGEQDLQFQTPEKQNMGTFVNYLTEDEAYDDKNSFVSGNLSSARSNTTKNKNRRHKSSMHIPESIMNKANERASLYNPMVAQAYGDDANALRMITQVSNQMKKEGTRSTFGDQSPLLRLTDTQPNEIFGGEALIESESFAVHSNVDFLMLVGKICAQGKCFSEEGLKALNDYLLIIDYMSHTMVVDLYHRLRAQTVYLIGCILYREQDYENAMKYLCSVALELQRANCKKQLIDCQKKVAKIWELRTRNINFAYFTKQSQPSENDSLNDFQVINNK